MRTAWDSDALYLFVEVPDADVRDDAPPGRLWDRDCIEVYLDVLNRGGKREHGLLDFHYTFTPSGAAQVEGGKKIVGTRAVGKRTETGYRLEIRLDMAELSLHPVPDYVLGFNVRRLDYGVKDGKAGWVGADILSPTPSHPSTTTEGYAKLRLIGGEPPGAAYRRDTNTLALRGLGNNLAAAAQKLQNASVMACSGSDIKLGANVHLAAGAELILGGGTVSKSDNLPACVLSADKGSRIHLAGDVALSNVDAVNGLKACILTSETRNRLIIMKRVAVKLADKQGRPIRNAAIGVRVAEAGRFEALSDTAQRSDDQGTLRLDLPAAVFEVELDKATFHEKRYDLVINDTAVTAIYALTGVAPLTQQDYKLTCPVNR
ncbi:MAG: hypothetical protein FJ279_30425 [Planctomycetes bacterium]|nr:hypothetical protein [Planctomycetota bacterium]